MTKYIIDYMSGAKGDFLVNFLNDNPLRFENALNKTRPVNDLKLLKFYIKNNNFDEINSRLQKSSEFISCHWAHLLPEFIKTNYDLKIIKLNIEDDYVLSASIEGLVKHFISKVNYIELFKNLKNYSNINYLDYKKVKYQIDINLFESNLEINDQNRYDYFMNFVKNNNFIFDLIVEHNLNDYEVIDTLSYSDLYIKNNFTKLQKIKLNFDSEKFKSAVEKTWLPDKIDMFGKVWYPYEYGYRKF